jgi:hypothetical protein
MLTATGVRYGFGQNVWDLDLSTILAEVSKAVRTLFICQCLHAVSLTLVKLSIISTYWRIFQTSSVRWTLGILGAAITGVSIATIFGTLFQCEPVAGAWDFLLPAKCISIRELYYFSTAFSVFTDVALCVLPLPFFWTLKVSRREKIIVSCLFGLGLFAAAASVARITVLGELNDVNVTMRAIPALNWSIAEVFTGIAVACVPCLKPVFVRFVPGKLFTAFKTSTSTVDELPKISRQESQALAHLSVSGSGLWRGRGASWYQRPLKSSPSWWGEQRTVSQQ